MDADQRPERRRSERIPSRIPITLALKYQDWEFQQSACAVDISSRGLRIRTEPALNEGHGIYFFSDEGVLHPGYCRVAWFVWKNLMGRVKQGWNSYLSWPRVARVATRPSEEIVL